MSCIGTPAYCAGTDIAREYGWQGIAVLVVVWLVIALIVGVINEIR